MLAIKKARKIILTNPEHPGAKVLAALVIALETNHPFPLNQLYTLDFEQFELALEERAISSSPTARETAITATHAEE